MGVVMYWGERVEGGVTVEAHVDTAGPAVDSQGVAVEKHREVERHETGCKIEDWSACLVRPVQASDNETDEGIKLARRATWRRPARSIEPLL
jgi:hypothetical protein